MFSNVNQDHLPKDRHLPRHKATPGLLTGTRRRLRRWWAANGSSFNGATPLPIPADERRDRARGRRRATPMDGSQQSERPEGVE